MSTESFYPNLGTLVSLDAFPEELHFLENGLQQVLDGIYYKDLQYSKSEDTSTAYYNIVLVNNESLKVDLFGTKILLKIKTAFI